MFGFLALALLRTLGWLPDLTVHLPAAAGVGHVERDFSSSRPWRKLAPIFFIVMSMAGVGLETKFSAMRQTGWRPFFAAAVCALVIASVVLGLIELLHIV